MFIDAFKGKYTVKGMCKCLETSESVYYHWLKNKSTPFSDIRYKFYYWVYSGWFDWDDDYPYDAYDVEERTLYRYKEK